jgi:halimadienyl-diphosphate synthase
MIDENAVQDLLREVGPGRMSSLAYDTAWVARLVSIDPELSNNALDWICANQLLDGSWGAVRPFYYHDRVISTLAAMIALNRGRRTRDRFQIERGQAALDRITHGATSGLHNDPNGPTVGFEMIAPPLAAEAEKLGLIRNQGSNILGRLAGARQKKLALLQGKLINRKITAAFSAEMTGLDGLETLDLPNLKESDGSVGHSPSATAFYLLSIDPQDQEALSYLHRIANIDGGIPNLVPFDIFETAWTLWNLSLVDSWNSDSKELMRSHLNYLWECWRPGQGVSLSKSYSIPDGDDTAIAFELLACGGYEPDIDSLLSFEEEEHFRTYQFEANSSNSVASHVLGALRRAGRTLDDKSLQKTLKYLKKTAVDDYWFDKWHLSPFYTTSQAIIACAGFADDLVRKSVDWMLATQRDDGSWGQHFPTAEETAYCLQALAVWMRYNGNHKTISNEKLKQGAVWLSEHAEPPYPPLWIGKGLYCPELVVRSAILSALRMVQES